MSSFSRNIRRANSLRRARVLGAGFALALASAAALADGAHRFVFTAYSDAAGGADVVGGRYRNALEELKDLPESMESDPSAINTNRCVAYSMTLQWREARAACDAAVQAAAVRRELPTAWWGQRQQSGSDAMAVAYSNRAVLSWLMHDDAAARSDLARAHELSPRAQCVARNLAALATHGLVAQAGTPVPKG